MGSGPNDSCVDSLCSVETWLMDRIGPLDHESIRRNWRSDHDDGSWDCIRSWAVGLDEEWW